MADIPALGEQIGNDIVTASGKTLLGADNKAGVAAIMAAVEHLVRHPEIAHGVVRIGFTPDEEIGRGADHFDVKRFGATCAYTMDGEGRGRLEAETFSGDAMTVTFRGFNTHPGFAKGKMVNAIKAVADFIASLPKDRLSPETTEDRQGFAHPYVLQGGVGEASVKFIIRDFETPKLAEIEASLERLAKEAAARWPGVSVTSKVTQSYRNMREALERVPQVVENAREAIRRAGLDPRDTSIRGGTDGCRLSFMGLPTPNLFAGENNFHLEARVGLRAGHGQVRRDDRAPLPDLGGEGVGRTTCSRCARASYRARCPRYQIGQRGPEAVFERRLRELRAEGRCASRSSALKPRFRKP